MVPLSGLEKRAHSRWGHGLAGKQCLCREKPSLPLHSAVLDWSVASRDHFVQSPLVRCLPPVFNGGSLSLGTLLSHL